MVVKSLQGDTVDLICWRYYGRTAGVLEQVLDSNRGLAALGPVLPMGTMITLPDQPVQAGSKQIVQLWD